MSSSVTSSNPIEVFISYAHEDKGLSETLIKHLSLLKRQGIIKDWYDHQIGAGEEWEGQILEHLNSAKVILLLVSADFMASDYIYDVELKRAMERHEAGDARVIPIILRPCDWTNAPFSKLQALPSGAEPITKWPDRDEAFLNVATGIRKAAGNLQRKTPSSSNKEKISAAPSSISAQRGVNKQMKILVLTANPVDTTPLRLDEEVREIDAGLRRARHREQFVIVEKWAVRIRDLRRAMLDESPQIVHFSGHGNTEGIALEDNDGQAQLVNKEAVAGLFALFTNDVQCVVLNACYSAPQAEAISQHIPYVIGMSQEIGDRAAIEFAVGFYDALGAGRSVEDAYAFGCNAIHSQGIPEHLTPVLKKKRR